MDVVKIGDYILPSLINDICKEMRLGLRLRGLPIRRLKDHKISPISI